MKGSKKQVRGLVLIRKSAKVDGTSMVSTRYSESMEIQAVIIKSQMIDSHLEISGPSSSSSLFS